VIPLLERSGELGVLQEKAQLAVGGSPQFVVIEGAAGIGKTSLLDEFVQFGAEGTMRPLRARCDEMERELAFGVVRQLFEPLLAEAPPDERERLLAGPARTAAGMLAGPVAPADLSCQVLQGLHWMTVNVACRTPVLLAIDDVHLADELSLRWLLYLARHLVDAPVLVVLTWRTGRHQVSLTDLVLHPGCTVIRPRPLGAASMSAVLADLLGVRPTAQFVRSCHRLTAGNPLLTRALGLSVSSCLTTWDGVTAERPPKSAVRVLSGVLLAWLADLTADAQEFARALAVLGDAVDVQLPARLAGLDPVRGGAACDELWQAGFVRADPVPQWTRPFVRETVLNGMAPQRRGELHAAAARLLSESGAPAHRVCAHLLQSPPGGDPWVVRTLCAHATHLCRRDDPELAATCLRRAAAEPPPERDRAAVLVALGMAESYARPGAAVEYLTEAMSQIDDPATLGMAGRWMSDSMVREGRAVEAVDLLGRLSGELIDRDREAGVLLHAHRTVIAVAMAPHVASPVAQIVSDVSGFQGNTVAGRAALGAAAFAGALLGATADRTAELALRALPTTSSEMANPSVVHTIAALSWADKLDTAAQRCDVAIAEARRCNALFALAMLLDSRASIAWLAGELQDASGFAQRARDTMRTQWWGALGALHHGTTLRIMVDSGDTADAQRLMAVLDSDALAGEDFPSLSLSGICAGVRIASGDLRGGLAAVLDCGDRLVRAGYENPIPVPWRIWGTKACVQLGEFDTARQLANAAVEHARHWGTARAIGGAMHALGSATRGMAGVRLIQEGIELLESSPARLDLTHALIGLGTMQQEQGLHREARGTLRRALELAERCGARDLVTTIRQFLPHAGARRASRPATGLDALTESERRVAQLAMRWSNRKIAEELHLTLRTVETHLSATYRKLGITGRTELHELFPGDHSSSRTA
jgi:DNA-binding CsgD family transcriptional regulator